jgi:glycoprotein endo-alpha-1,2-mannosidase
MAVLIPVCLALALFLGVPATPPPTPPDAWGKRVLAFYYGWYGRPQSENPHWAGVDTANRRIANSAHYPLLGSYDSHDPGVVDQQLCWAGEAHTDLIVSWWGKDDPTDKQLRILLSKAGAYNVSVTAYIERIHSRTREEALAQVQYLLSSYGHHPAWLKVGGKPVIFIYSRAVWDIYPGNWQWVVQEARRTHPAIFVGDRLSMEPSHISAGAPLLNVFDGVHVYNVTDSIAGKSPDQITVWAQKTYTRWVNSMGARVKIVTVIPGFDDRKVLPPRPAPRPVTDRHAGATYRNLWQAAVQANPDWVLVTSVNELHEGSGIEPTLEHGNRELRATAEFAPRFRGLASPQAPRCRDYSVVAAPATNEQGNSD